MKFAQKHVLLATGMTIALGMASVVNAQTTPTDPAVSGFDPTQAPTATVPVRPATSGSGISAQRAGRMVEYLGGGYLTVSEECADHGWTGTHPIMMRAQPQGEGSNDPNLTEIALYFPTGTVAMKYDRNNGNRYGDIEPEVVTYVWNGPWVPEYPITTIGFNSRYGNWIGSGDENLISVFMFFENFNEIEGCTARIRVSLGRI